MGVYRSSPLTDKSTSVGESQQLEYAASDMQGWRMTMEDARLTELDFDNVSCFGVFDGHGGKEVAIYAAKHFTEELRRNSNFQTQTYEQALIDVYLRIDDLLRTPEGINEIYWNTQKGESGDRPDPNYKSTAGCTAVVAIVTSTSIIVANAGDSRCILARPLYYPRAGTAIALTHDHKPELPEEINRIRNAGGYVEMGRVNGNLNLTRSLGDFDYKTNPNIPPQDQIITAYPDTTTMKLTEQDDFLVLGCDGIWDMLTNQEAVDFIYERITTTPLSTIVEQLIDRCLAPSTQAHAGLGCDNMTAVIVKFKR